MTEIKLKTSLPGPESLRLMERRKKAVSRGPFHTTPLFASKAFGSFIEDVDGNVLLDFTSGIGVTNLGHCNPAIREAIAKQAQNLQHSSFNVVAYETYISLCEKLNSITPGSFAKKTFLANSGAEAVENAIKIARMATGKQGIVCFEHAFHGRTYMAMTLTAKAKPYRYSCGPYMSEIYRAPYPYVYRWENENNKIDEDQVSRECFQKFADLIQSQISLTQTAAVIMEPVLGEGGFVPAPKLFLQLVEKFCQENKILLIADEIQTGFGRTGKLFACEHSGITPDIILTAKGLGGGMPISAVTGRAEFMDAPIEGSIGGTFGGNPVSTAAALEVINLFLQTPVLQNALLLGEVLQSRLRQWQNQFTFIGDVRGLGPMQAIEFVSDRTTKAPAPELTKKLQKTCYEQGLILMGAGTYGNVIRFLMPLTTTVAELEQGLKIIENSLHKI